MDVAGAERADRLGERVVQPVIAPGDGLEPVEEDEMAEVGQIDDVRIEAFEEAVQHHQRQPEARPETGEDDDDLVGALLVPRRIGFMATVDAHAAPVERRHLLEDAAPPELA